MDYEGGGIGEYQYWDRSTEQWDATACNYAEGGSSRCAKMDCHLETTHFSVLGFFKHKNYDDWMEQLFVSIVKATFLSFILVMMRQERTYTTHIAIPFIRNMKGCAFGMMMVSRGDFVVSCSS